MMVWSVSEIDSESDSDGSSNAGGGGGGGVSGCDSNSDGGGDGNGSGGDAKSDGCGGDGGGGVLVTAAVMTMIVCRRGGPAGWSAIFAPSVQAMKDAGYGLRQWPLISHRAIAIVCFASVDDADLIHANDDPPVSNADLLVEAQATLATWQGRLLSRLHT